MRLSLFKAFFCMLVYHIPFYIKAESLSIPSATIPSGYDRITTSDGASCESTIASDMYIQTGLMGVKVNQEYGHNTKHYDSSSRLQDRDNFGIYAQIVIPIGERKKRIDCSRLYELEIRNLKAQLLKLKLESMSDDIWDE
ncbi:hypothetical protein CTB58_004023 [Vibrio mimicus]